MEDEVGGACGTNAGEEVLPEFWWRNLNERFTRPRHRLEDVGWFLLSGDGDSWRALVKKAGFSEKGKEYLIFVSVGIFLSSQGKVIFSRRALHRGVLHILRISSQKDNRWRRSRGKVTIRWIDIFRLNMWVVLNLVKVKKIFDIISCLVLSNAIISWNKGNEIFWGFRKLNCSSAFVIFENCADVREN